MLLQTSRSKRKISYSLMSTPHLFYVLLCFAIAGCSRNSTESRGFSISSTTKQQLEEAKNAATRIQNNYRRHHAKKQLEEAKNAATRIQNHYRQWRKRFAERQNPLLKFIGELNRILHTANNSAGNLALVKVLEKYRELREIDRRIEELRESLIFLPEHEKKIEEIQNELRAALELEKNQLGQLEEAVEYLKDFQKVKTKEIHSSVEKEKKYIQEKFPYVEQILSKDSVKARKSLKKKKKKLSEIIIRHKKEISYMGRLSNDKKNGSSNTKQVLSIFQKKKQRINEICESIEELQQPLYRKRRKKKKRLIATQGKKLDTIIETIDES